MRSIRRGVRRSLTMVAALLLTLVSVTPAAAAPPTWKLADYLQQVCLRPDQPRETYFFSQVNGTWENTITTGIRDFPPGSVAEQTTTFPPGSHHEDYVNGFMWVAIAAAPEGDHYGEIWATDGVVTQTAPVLLRYSTKTNCWA
ncbi:DUF5980 family protein [Actinophytocola sediminis]